MNIIVVDDCHLLGSFFFWGGSHRFPMYTPHMAHRYTIGSHMLWFLEGYSQVFTVCERLGI